MYPTAHAACPTPATGTPHARLVARTRPSAERDLVRIIETAYSSEPNDAAWLRKVATAASPAFDLGEGVLATFIDPGDRKLRDPVLLGCSDAHHRFALGAGARMADDEVARIFSNGQALTTARENIGLRPGQAMPGPLGELAEECGFVDAAVLLVADPTRLGFVLAAPFRRAWAPSRRDRTRWSRVAVHLAAAYRLQRHASTPAPSAGGAVDEAVLDPDGKIQHAEGAARDEKSRVWLRRAARAMDRARSTQHRENPDEVLALWEGLVAGRWSLVDRFDSDGRRYLVARKNDPDVQVAAALTQREQQVVGYATLGHANKFIAYELGVSQPNVSECIQRACAKLGVRSRVELIQLQRVGGRSSVGATTIENHGK